MHQVVVVRRVIDWFVFGFTLSAVLILVTDPRGHVRDRLAIIGNENKQKTQTGSNPNRAAVVANDAGRGCTPAGGQRIR